MDQKKGDPPLLVRGIKNWPPTAASSPYAWFGSDKGVVGRERNGEGAKGTGKGKGGGGTVTVRWRGEIYRTTQRQKR